jgi:hypothetical protein
MDWAEFEHQRASGFRTVRHGYDKNEVDLFIRAVADWLETDAVQELGDGAVERKLEVVGQSTARILLIAEQQADDVRRKAEDECAELRNDAETVANESTTRILEAAEQQAGELRRKTEEECAELRANAEAAANETSSRAEQYATRVRAKADEAAKRKVDDAITQARSALLEETERQQAKMDAVVAELERRRHAAVDEVERLRADLLAAVSKHTDRIAPVEGEGTVRRRHTPTYGPSKRANA